jgi:phosphoribosyl 1,2-cyclic phosphate phosphodiesterase
MPTIRRGSTICEPLPIYGFPEILQEIQRRFAYLFGGSHVGYYDKPLLRPVEAAERMRIGSLDVTCFEQDHAVCRTLGVRVGDFAYSTDVKILPDAALAALSGIDCWVVAAVRREPHIAHAHLDQILEWIERLSPEQAYLTHMNQTMDYRTLLEALPPGIAPAYDGLAIERDG